MPASDYRYVAALASRVQKGDNNAFAELYAATFQQQYRFACRYLDNQTLARDALTEIYSEALKTITALKEPSLIVAWLNQINFRICYELQKKYRLHRLRVIDFNTEDTYSFQADSLEKDTSLEHLVSDASSREYLMNQILKLPFSEAQVIILWHFQHMTYNEIARVMNIRRTSVRRYLSKGHRHLSDIISRMQ